MDIETLITQGLDHFNITYSADAVARISFYVTELERWNRRINLTGKETIASIIKELLYDAFFLHARVEDCRSLLDLGSGSGALAIPLAILGEERKVYSIDKSLRKIQFQRHIKRTLRLGNLSLLHGRVETFAPLTVDLLVAKAFGSVREILEAGGRHLVPSGHAFMLRGKEEKPSPHGGFCCENVVSYRLPGGEKEYQLFVYKNVS